MSPDFLERTTSSARSTRSTSPTPPTSPGSTSSVSSNSTPKAALPKMPARSSIADHSRNTGSASPVAATPAGRHGHAHHRRHLAPHRCPLLRSHRQPLPHRQPHHRHRRRIIRLYRSIHPLRAQKVRLLVCNVTVASHFLARYGSLVSYREEI